MAKLNFQVKHKKQNKIKQWIRVGKTFCVSGNPAPCPNPPKAMLLLGLIMGMGLAKTTWALWSVFFFSFFLPFFFFMFSTYEWKWNSINPNASSQISHLITLLRVVFWHLFYGLYLFTLHTALANIIPWLDYRTHRFKCSKRLTILKY